jgi:hypothetical protein
MKQYLLSVHQDGQLLVTDGPFAEGKEHIGGLPYSAIEIQYRLVLESYEVAAAANLDRLLHYSITVNIRGESHRLKDKNRPGLRRGLGQAGRLKPPGLGI